MLSAQKQMKGSRNTVYKVICRAKRKLNQGAGVYGYNSRRNMPEYSTLMQVFSTFVL